MAVLEEDDVGPESSEEEVRRTLRAIVRLLRSRESDFDSLRQLQMEWLQFQTTLARLIHLIDGNGHPPIAERILILEEHTRRLEQVSQQIDSVKHRLIGLLVSVILSLVAAVFSLLR